jgi:uncharacterized protein (TIGR03067 family)
MVRFYLILALLFGPVACVRADEANAKELRLLEGRWALTSVERDGKAEDLGDDPPRWVFKGNRVLYAGDELAAVTLGAGSTPKTIDLAWARPKRDYEGIYTLDGDTLRICVNRQTEGAKNRPQDLKTDGSSDFRLLVFRRDMAESPGVLDGVRGFVGIMIGVGDQKEVVVTGALDGSPAKAAGLRKDDVLVAVGAADATDLQTVIGVVRRQKPGDELTLKIKRDGKPQEVKVKVGKMPFFYLD